MPEIRRGADFRAVYTDNVFLYRSPAGNYVLTFSLDRPMTEKETAKSIDFVRELQTEIHMAPSSFERLSKVTAEFLASQRKSA